MNAMKLLLLGGAAYLVWHFYQQSQAGGGTASTTGTSGGGPPVLTVQNAATVPWSSALAPQIAGIQSQLNQAFAGGQIPTIGGGSVLAYMLGWGGAASGSVQTVSGETYKFDGTNWTLQARSTGGAAPPAVTKAALSVALATWATKNGYGSTLNMSQWNYILAALVPGAAPLMTDPTNGGTMTASDYVKYLQADSSYSTAAIAQSYGLAGWFNRPGVGAYMPTGYVRPGTPFFLGRGPRVVSIRRRA